MYNQLHCHCYLITVGLLHYVICCNKLQVVLYCPGKNVFFSDCVFGSDTCNQVIVKDSAGFFVCFLLSF